MVSAFQAFALLLGAVSVTCVNVQVLVDFQVAEPPPVPRNVQTCTMKILERTFGNSYGHPEIVQYSPPADCGEPGSWAAVTLNFTVTSNGTQYDRLGVFTFQNTEIWRTSTPEPTKNGIIWTYIKDVTRYIPLFAKSGTFILELGNVLESGLNGQYATTVYATFYATSQEHPTAGQSNLIVPISTMSSNSANDASVPPAFSVNVTLPRNTVQIYAELYASGNYHEEFWYVNGADRGGPFCEVRLLVDGQVAGVAFPYAVIFTGGINPLLWMPITSYGALDLPTYFLDLTPFAPIFADGRPHNVTLDVASGEANHTPSQNWFVSGLLQVVTDPSGKPTTGGITRYDVQPYAVTETTADTVRSQRSLYIEAVVISGSGQKTTVAFQQNLNYTNTQYYPDNANNLAQVSSGSVLSLHNGVRTVVDNFEYPLYINRSFQSGYTTTIDHSYNRQVIPAPFIMGSNITERQQTTGCFTMTSAGAEDNTENGSKSNNTFAYTDTKGNTYNREVDAANGVIIYDKQSGSLATNTPSLPAPSTAPSPQDFPPARVPGGQ